MDNKDRLDFLYNKREELHKQMDIILMEISLLSWEDKVQEELIRDYNKFNQELYDVEIEIVARGGILC